MDEDFLPAGECGRSPSGAWLLKADRLVMRLTGEDSVREVFPVPALRPEG